MKGRERRKLERKSLPGQNEAVTAILETNDVRFKVEEKKKSANS